MVTKGRGSSFRWREGRELSHDCGMGKTCCVIGVVILCYFVLKTEKGWGREVWEESNTDA